MKALNKNQLVYALYGVAIAGGLFFAESGTQKNPLKKFFPPPFQVKSVSAEQFRAGTQSRLPAFVSGRLVGKQSYRFIVSVKNQQGEALPKIKGFVIPDGNAYEFNSVTSEVQWRKDRLLVTLTTQAPQTFMKTSRAFSENLNLKFELQIFIDKDENVQLALAGKTAEQFSLSGIRMEESAPKAFIGKWQGMLDGMVAEMNIQQSGFELVGTLKNSDQGEQRCLSAIYGLPTSDSEAFIFSSEPNTTDCIPAGFRLTLQENNRIKGRLYVDTGIREDFYFEKGSAF